MVSATIQESHIWYAISVLMTWTFILCTAEEEWVASVEPSCWAASKVCVELLLHAVCSPQLPEHPEAVPSRQAPAHYNTQVTVINQCPWASVLVWVGVVLPVPRTLHHPHLQLASTTQAHPAQVCFSFFFTKVCSHPRLLISKHAAAQPDMHCRGGTALLQNHCLVCCLPPNGGSSQRLNQVFRKCRYTWGTFDIYCTVLHRIFMWQNHYMPFRIKWLWILRCFTC